MLFSEALEIRPGLTAVMGSGGKTSLVCRLADELSAARVIIATSTHMRQVPALQTRVCAVAPGTPAIVGTPCGDGKFGPPEQSWAELCALADYVLVEADGSKRLPLKAHADWEPAVPKDSKRCVLVLGGSGFGRPACEAVHRPELFCELVGCGDDAVATPELVATAIAAETAAGRIAPDVVVVNQAEDPRVVDAAWAFTYALRAHGVGVPVLAGSIRDAELVACG